MDPTVGGKHAIIQSLYGKEVYWEGKEKRDINVVNCLREAAGRESVVRWGLSIKGTFAPVQTT